MPSPSLSVLVLGCGSIGERHLRCFLHTGRVRAAVCDTNSRLVAEVAGRYGVPGFDSLEAAQAAFAADAWVICTPAHTHLPLTLRALDLGRHVLIEKPLAVDLTQVPAVRQALAASDRHVAVAYVYHAMPWVQALRAALQQGDLGAPKHASIVAGQHFPTFRPAYREIYYTRHETGGGAIQDALTHLANLMEWLLGPTTRLYCDAAHQVLEGVTVEDTVNVSARQGDILVSYAMNQFQAPNEVDLRIHCERGSFAIEWQRRRWGVQRLGEADWTWHESPPLERDELFTRQAHAFIDGVEGGASPLCTFEEAVQSLKFNLAALESARTGQAIALS